MGKLGQVGLLVAMSVFAATTAFAQEGAFPPGYPADQPSAQADPDELARAAFLLGQGAFESGDFGSALEHFQHAYRLSPRPALLFNIGSSLDRLRRNEDALENFRRYLENDATAPNAPEVEGRIRVLEAAIAQERQDEQEEERRLAEAHAGAESGGIFSEWWFWVLTGAVLAGAGVLTFILLNEESFEEPVMGNVPGVTFTLRGF